MINPMNSSKEEIVLSRDNRELFVIRLVKVFFSKSKARGGAKSKNMHPSWLYSTMVELSEAATWAIVQESYSPQLTLLYRGRTFRSSHRRYCVRKLLLKFCNIHRKHLCCSLFLKTLQTFRPATLLKRDPNTGVFLWMLQIYTTYFEKHIQKTPF